METKDELTIQDSPWHRRIDSISIEYDRYRERWQKRASYYEDPVNDSKLIFWEKRARDNHRQNL